MPSTTINGIRLHWSLTGESGEPLILVHGSWIDHRNWDPIVPALAHSYRVVTYDRRGHSQTERPPGPDSVSDDVSEHPRFLDLHARALGASLYCGGTPHGCYAEPIFGATPFNCGMAQALYRDHFFPKASKASWIVFLA